jgi:hypothetical protein
VCNTVDIFANYATFDELRSLIVGFVAFAGKFFCIPHSTENALEKYRYRRKEDEIRDVENRHRELLSLKTTNDWDKDSSEVAAVDGRRAGAMAEKSSSRRKSSTSGPMTHKDRLLNRLDHNARGSTPER